MLGFPYFLINFYTSFSLLIFFFNYGGWGSNPNPNPNHIAK